VVSFDYERGLGTVADEQGTQTPFHCTAIADGSRSIEVGASVCYEICPGPGASLWATNLTGLSPGPPQ
jgi:cold shock CspA family protein